MKIKLEKIIFNSCMQIDARENYIGAHIYYQKYLEKLVTLQT